jgi:hypothetical protein
MVDSIRNLVYRKRVHDQGTRQFVRRPWNALRIRTPSERTGAQPMPCVAGRPEGSGLTEHLSGFFVDGFILKELFFSLEPVV